MNIRRILIDESEKSRILEMHSSKKQLINEATAADFPACVRYAGKISDQIQFSSDVATKVLGNGIYSAIVVVDPSTKYTYNWLGKPKVIVGVPTDPNDTTRSTYVKSYHCGCKNGKLRPISRPYDGKEIQDETKCDQVPGDLGGDQGGDKGANCKNKTPYDALTGGGLNWKEERQKWIDANCNGTTPCKLGDATTNINLRNAYCDGTWPPKKDVAQTPEQIEACKTKCAAVPLQAGQVGPQVQGWFFSRDGVCYEATGTGGFSSKAECEACKCGTLKPGGDGSKPGEGGTLPGGDGSKPGEGGTLPGGEGGQKLPDFIPPTIVKPSKPLD
jgi:hypothetical protein